MVLAIGLNWESGLDHARFPALLKRSFHHETMGRPGMEPMSPAFRSSLAGLAQSHRTRTMQGLLGRMIQALATAAMLLGAAEAGLHHRGPTQPSSTDNCRSRMIWCLPLKTSGEGPVLAGTGKKSCLSDTNRPWTSKRLINGRHEPLPRISPVFRARQQRHSEVALTIEPGWSCCRDSQSRPIAPRMDSGTKPSPPEAPERTGPRPSAQDSQVREALRPATQRFFSDEQVSPSRSSFGAPSMVTQFRGAEVFGVDWVEAVKLVHRCQSAPGFDIQSKVLTSCKLSSLSGTSIALDDRLYTDYRPHKQFSFSLNNEVNDSISFPTGESLTDNVRPADRAVGVAPSTIAGGGTTSSPGHPGDSKPESKSPKRTEASGHWQNDAVLVSGLIVAVMLALATLMARSRTGGRNLIDQTLSDAMASGQVANPTGPPLSAGSATSLAATDGSHQIALNRDLLASPEGLVIGKTLEMCHVGIREPGVARRHVRMRLARSSLWIEDLNSSTGTEIDGTVLEPFMPVQVSPEQVLRIGLRSYKLRAGDLDESS